MRTRVGGGAIDQEGTPLVDSAQHATKLVILRHLLNAADSESAVQNARRCYLLQWLQDERDPSLLAMAQRQWNVRASGLRPADGYAQRRSRMGALFDLVALGWGSGGASSDGAHDPE